ncbi:hypothetical protein [uncultured Duncaniella sp.]|uniref:hypothetical protein n=1 Tax=uncultured Duncaniella sp. TaxID=2768039 RepID=UPI0026053547|nr:hypothetical protein [uncultured Duncaniella sp.]
MERTGCPSIDISNSSIYCNHILYRPSQSLPFHSVLPASFEQAVLDVLGFIASTFVTGIAAVVVLLTRGALTIPALKTNHSDLLLSIIIRDEAYTR